MIDLKYHIASIVGIFLALGMGILIGSTIVGDNLLVDQQKKVIDRLEEQFYALRSKEEEMTRDNQYKGEIINKYENYGQAMLPVLVKGQLKDYRVAVVVSGDSDVPPGMLNALSMAGAQVVSKSVVLSEMNLKNVDLRNRLIDYYHLEKKSSSDTLRYHVAASVGILVTGEKDPELGSFLQQNDLVKFSGEGGPVNAVILVGGANNLSAVFADSFDRGLIQSLQSQQIKVFGVENSRVSYSYMESYQKEDITTIDNVDLSPGQVSLIMAMNGQPGRYGMKASAQKFMPALPVNAAIEQ
ncbi:copper transporter [Syntrophomonas palmitatica]|uniref:copper transporter n=1 Tax=Syntrophomonas palmitatica TaxID=402877 RepID=UPI0006D03AB2|nr:copper transporter [Syntrophomonas palmitatica]